MATNKRKRENVMGLELNERGRTRIRFDSIPYYGDSHERVAGQNCYKVLKIRQQKCLTAYQIT